MSNDRKGLSAIIFDMDHTIISSFALITNAFSHIGQKYLNKTFSQQEVVSMFGPTERGIIANIIGKDNFETAVKDYYEYYMQNHDNEVEYYEGYDEIFSLCRENGLILCLNTGKGIDSTMISLEQLGLKDCFDMVISGDDVTNPKPDPEGVLRFLEKYNLDKDTVLFVGDSTYDVNCAKNAGVLSGAALWDSSYTERVLALNPDYVFYSTDELKDCIFKKLNLEPA